MIDAFRSMKQLAALNPLPAICFGFLFKNYMQDEKSGIISWTRRSGTILFLFSLSCGKVPCCTNLPLFFHVKITFPKIVRLHRILLQLGQSWLPRSPMDAFLLGKKRKLNHFGGADVAILFFVHQCKRCISPSQIFYSSSTDVFLLKLWPSSQVSMHMRALAKLSEKPGSNNARSPFYDHCFTFNKGVDAMVLLDLKRQVSQKHNCQCRFIQSPGMCIISAPFKIAMQKPTWTAPWPSKRWSKGARISPERIDAWFQMNIRFFGPIHNNLATGMAKQIARFS